MNQSAKKDASDSKDKSSSRKQPARNRKRAGGAKDDDSVDSHGNIRDLIAYSDTEEELTSSEDETFHTEDAEETPESELSEKDRIIIRKHAKRAAAVKARERIRRKLAKPKRKIVVESESESEEEEPKKSKKSKNSKKSKKSKKEESESEEEEEEEDEYERVLEEEERDE